MGMAEQNRRFNPPDGVLGRPWGAFWWSSLICLGALLLASPSARAHGKIVGTYRCASAQVGKRMGQCVSPPLILHADGRYHIWGEQGTYKIRGRWLYLSESKKRGPGRLCHSREIIFQYSYRGQRHTVKFRREVTGKTGQVYT
jgi:hypothetical protein